MVGGLGLGNEALVVLEERLDGVLDLPLADIAESLAADRSLLGGLGGRPPLGPALGELLEEGSLDGCGLWRGGQQRVVEMWRIRVSESAGNGGVP